jgi:hypothetical protein
MTFVSCLSIDAKDLWDLLDTPMFPCTLKLVMHSKLAYLLRDYVRNVAKVTFGA